MERNRELRTLYTVAPLSPAERERETQPTHHELHASPQPAIGSSHAAGKHGSDKNTRRVYFALNVLLAGPNQRNAEAVLCSLIGRQLNLATMLDGKACGERLGKGVWQGRKKKNNIEARRHVRNRDDDDAPRSLGRLTGPAASGPPPCQTWRWSCGDEAATGQPAAWTASTWLCAWPHLPPNDAVPSVECLFWRHLRQQDNPGHNNGNLQRKP